MPRILLLLTTVLVLASCSAELEVNAPYQETPVLYGLLNPNDTLHRVRVTKAFLSEGQSALLDAQIADSSEYAPGEVTVELFTGGNLVGTFTPTTVEKEPGTFYQQQGVYELAAALDETRTYEVRITTAAATARAQTDLVGTTIIRRPTQLLGPSIFRDFTINLSAVPPEEGAQIVVELDQVLVTYTEFTTTDSVEQSVVLDFNRSLPVGIDATLDVEDFRRRLAEAIPADDLAVRSRRLDSATFFFVSANQLLADYIRINSNTSPLTQTVPYFSNVENGLGLLASRRDFQTSALGIATRVDGINALNQVGQDLFGKDLRFER